MITTQITDPGYSYELENRYQERAKVNQREKYIEVALCLRMVGLSDASTQSVTINLLPEVAAHPKQ